MFPLTYDVKWRKLLNPTKSILRNFESWIIFCELNSITFQTVTYVKYEGDTWNNQATQVRAYFTPRRQIVQQ